MRSPSSYVSLFSIRCISEIRPLLLPLVMTGLLFGCSGDSSSGADPVASPPAADTASREASLDDIVADSAIPDGALPDDTIADDTASVSLTDTTHTGAIITRANPPHTPPIFTPSGKYTRDFDYPAMVTLPLQFITRPNGKKLGVLVTLPADKNGQPVDGKFPVVLVQTGYNMSLVGAILRGVPGMSILGAPDTWIVRHGYAEVTVDVVGTGVSQGGWELFGEDELLGYGDTVDWIQQQSWSNGNIGVSGYSYMAISALFTAERRPDAIKAVFAMSPIGDAVRGIVGTGGLINGLFISVWATLTHGLGQQNQLPELQYPQYRDYIKEVNQEHFDQLDGFLAPMVADGLDGAPYLTYDSDFWRTRSPLVNIATIEAPVLLTGTLQDLFQRDEPLLYEGLKNNVDTRLVIYDGDHTTNFLQAFAGGDEVDPMLNLYLQWFDKYLKGIDSGVENIPAVTQFVLNYREIKKSKGVWRGFATTTDWPHPQLGTERWYLHGDMTVDRTRPEETEAPHSIAMPEPADVSWGKSDNGKYIVADLTFHDGTDCSISYRQWTLGFGGLNTNPCFYKNNDVEKDALNFESATMDDNYYINGPIQADIWLESTATDAVLSVRVDEVSPDGVVRQFSNGLLLASNRAVDESRSRFVDGVMIQPFYYLAEDKVMPVVPGEVIKLPVEIFPTSGIILKGHKLRVSISASNQAQGILNYPRQAQLKGSSITIHNSPQYPSSVVLPVVPMSALN